MLCSEEEEEEEKEGEEEVHTRLSQLGWVDQMSSSSPELAALTIPAAPCNNWDMRTMSSNHVKKTACS